ncbi:MAG TPA: PQQ-binding-like beta-propeller repeat protein, partial [Acidimicrobiales bacterium]|nr:PQQ-binding-like beta-propeller repeat protein [Acidimicrobiales bacterium]
MTCTVAVTALVTVAVAAVQPLRATALSPITALLRPHTAGLPSGWTETWSTGPLPDVGQPIALSSPVPADLDGQPSVVVGDRRGYLYAYHLASTSASGTPVAGWPTTDGSGPIDSTPSVVAGAGGLSTVLVGSGNDADPTTGGYQAYAPSGTPLWFTGVEDPPGDDAPDTGVEAGLAVGDLQGTDPDAVAGSLGQVSYALDADTGTPLTGWPYFNSDSTHSTAALADLYGTGATEVVVGGDQTAGAGRGQVFTAGGHVRILNAEGDQICRADTDQVVDSSPAVGGFLAGGATGIVVGTGSYFAGATDSDTLSAYDGRCQLQWSVTLDGSTYSSPALGDLLGNGALQVVEGTDQGAGQSGSVFALDPTTGRTLWEDPDLGRVIGSVVTADLSGDGYDDVIVPTTAGAWVLDGRTGAEIADLSPTLGLQNSPLVTDDPNGTVGITLAGYVSSTQSSAGVGQIDHYEIQGSDGALAVGAGSWPMFHHDPQLTGNAGGTTPPGSLPACTVPAAASTGYRLAGADGGVFAFGGAPYCGSMGGTRLAAPVVGIASSPLTGGYWEVAADGGVFAFGGAPFLGSMGGRHLARPIVGMAVTPDGRGYWEVAADGGVFAFGDAAFYGSMGGRHLAKPVVGIAPSTGGDGYRLVAADGGVFAFGDARFYGSGAATGRLYAGMASAPDGAGYG